MPGIHEFVVLVYGHGRGIRAVLVGDDVGASPILEVCLHILSCRILEEYGGERDRARCNGRLFNGAVLVLIARHVTGILRGASHHSSAQHAHRHRSCDYDTCAFAENTCFPHLIPFPVVIKQNQQRC